MYFMSHLVREQFRTHATVHAASMICREHPLLRLRRWRAVGDGSVKYILLNYRKLDPEETAELLAAVDNPDE